MFFKLILSSWTKNILGRILILREENTILFRLLIALLSRMRMVSTFLICFIIQSCKLYAFTVHILVMTNHLLILILLIHEYFLVFITSFRRFILVNICVIKFILQIVLLMSFNICYVFEYKLLYKSN